MQPSEPNRELEQSKMGNTLNYFQFCGGSYEIPIFNIDQRAYSHMISLVIIWYKYIRENVIGVKNSLNIYTLPSPQLLQLKNTNYIN